MRLIGLDSLSVAGLGVFATWGLWTTTWRFLVLLTYLVTVVISYGISGWVITTVPK